MPRDDYMPKDDLGKRQLFLSFAATLPEFYAELGLTVATPMVAQQIADAAAFDYLVRQQDSLKAKAQSATALKRLLMNEAEGLPKTPATLELTATLGTVPAPVPPGIVQRFRKLVRYVKNHPQFHPGMAGRLSLIGTLPGLPDRATLAPKLKVKAEGRRVYIRWNKRRLDALELHVDRGDGAGFQKLNVYTRALSEDTHPWPAQPIRWAYRGFYRHQDDQIGQWSATVEVTVGG